MPNESEEAVIAKEKPDYTEYYKTCHNNLSNQDAVNYLTSRGITMDTAEKFGLGYDANADPAYAPGGIGEKKYPERRIIIPVSSSYYLARAIDPDSEYPKPNPKGSSVSIFNSRVLYMPEVHVVYVVEGVFDALTIEQCGYSAIALNSVNAVGQLIKVLKNRPTTATLCICLDNDAKESVKKNVKRQLEKLEGYLKQKNIKYVVGDITEGHYKDVNEFIRANPEKCREAISTAIDRACKPDNTVLYIYSRMDREIALYKVNIPTGYSKMDKEGGLRVGLYCLAAIPSLGKTTFALQTADQIAAAGYDVIYFSLEMSRLELVSKSLSRITMLNQKQNSGDAIMSIQILNGQTGPISQSGKPIEQLSIELNNNSVSKAIDKYVKTVGDRVSIVEGNFGFSISSIRNYIQNYVNQNRKRPVVFIDYLQILQPEEVGGRKQTTKESVDTIVTNLKRLSRDLSIPIVIISSVNRLNYTTPISYESLKESGAIEYSCDVIWGMQLHCLSDEEMFEKDNKTVEKRKRIENAKAAIPREIDLVCIKNRFGKTGLAWTFKYYPAFDLFIEV